MADATAQFRRGAKAAKEASKFASFGRTQFLSMDDKDQVILRFLTDEEDWIVVDQHQMIPTKGKPDDYEGDKWPERMGAVCRRDAAFSGIHEDCYICDHIVDGKKVKKPSARNWALACLREEVQENGQIVGLRDQTREVAKVGEDGKPTGDTEVEKAIVVVNLGYKNFFSILEGFAGHYKTILDRDYIVKREGSGTDTIYHIVPLDPIDVKHPKTKKAVRFDVRDDAFRERYKGAPDLGQLVADRASDEFYARFFDPRYTISDKGVKKSGKTAPEPKPANEVDPDRMKELASRVKGYHPEAEAEAEGDGAEAPAEEEDKTPEETAAAASSGGMRDFG